MTFREMERVIAYKYIIMKTIIHTVDMKQCRTRQKDTHTPKVYMTELVSFVFLFFPKIFHNSECKRKYSLGCHSCRFPIICHSIQYIFPRGKISY